MPAKKRAQAKPTTPVETPLPFDVSTLLKSSDACLRDAMLAATADAHPKQIEYITAALMAVDDAMHAFTHPAQHFDECEDD